MLIHAIPRQPLGAGSKSLSLRNQNQNFLMKYLVLFSPWKGLCAINWIVYFGGLLFVLIGLKETHLPNQLIQSEPRLSQI